MTFTDAAAEVLRLVGRPLHYKEITDIAIEKNLLSHVGKSPEVTMGARLAATLKKDSPENPLVRVKPGVFALREWDDKTIRAGLEQKKGGRKPSRAESGVAQGAGAQGKDDDEEALAGGELEETPAADAEGTSEHADAADGGEAEHAMADQASSPNAHAPPNAHAHAHAHDAGPSAHDAGAEAAPNALNALNALNAPNAAPKAPNAAPNAPNAAGGAGAMARGSSRHGRGGRGGGPVAHREEVEEQQPAGPDDVMRAEAAAGAAEMFDEEEDDDQPILGGTDDQAVTGAVGADQGDGRRRRRRRRRGRTGGDAPAPSGGGLPSYTATPAFDSTNAGANANVIPNRRERGVDFEPRRDAPPPREREAAPFVDRRPDAVAERDAPFRPQLIELTGGDGHALDDLAGRELSDAVVAILSTFDRNAGAVSLRQIAETAQRRGRLSGEAQLVQSQVAAAVRADNARRLVAGQRPRFRLAGGRVALTDWLLSSDLARFEAEALAAVERYRDAARRAFARKLGELPGHAFVEICVLALERIGISQLRALRRAGAPGGETHFTGVLRAAASDELRLALVLRRDGREVGRERVADLRGSLHHYGPATAGWIFTAGQMLSGAREEAAVPGAAPIALFDGLAVARLCEENDVAVIRARLPIAIPDVDLLEALRAS